MPVIYPISSLIYSVFKLQWLCGSPCHFSLSHNTGSQKNSKAYLCFLWSQRINEVGRDLRRSLGHLTAPGRASYGVRPWCSCLSPFVTLNPPRTGIAQLSEQPAPLPHCPHEEKVSPYIQSETLLSKHIPVVSCPPSPNFCEEPGSTSLLTLVSAVGSVKCTEAVPSPGWPSPGPPVSSHKANAPALQFVHVFPVRRKWEKSGATSRCHLMSAT